jgi:LysR family transcriptional activator of nhaA
VGIPDGLPKLAVRQLLKPVLGEPGLRLLCHDDEFEDLLGELALHKLDLVISDRPAPPNPNLKLYSHSLGSSGIAWYAAPALAARVREAMRKDKAAGLAGALAQVPLLLPTGHGVLRDRLDLWFERQGQRPQVAGEFEDSALLETFGATGLGVFPSAMLADAEVVRSHGVERVGECDGVEEQFYAITPQKRIGHRLVSRITEAAGG